MRFIRIIALILFAASAAVYALGQQAVKRSDMEAPVITAESDYLQVEAGCEEAELLQGLTAHDNRDGDLTSDILIGTVGEFQEKGICTMEYLVFDKSNNLGRYERTVEFLNYESPKLSLKKPLVYKENEEIILSDRLCAEDVLTGDISNKLRYSASDLILTKSGTYELDVEVKNKYGDVVKEILPINIVPYSVEEELIQLREYLIYVKKGSDVKPKSYITNVTDTKGNQLDKGDVVISSEVDLTEAGSGQFRYELYKGEEVSYVTYLTVIVTE